MTESPDAKWLATYRAAMIGLMTILIGMSGFVGKGVIETGTANTLAIVKMQEQITTLISTTSIVAGASFTGRDAAAAESRQALVDAAQNAELDRHDRRLDVVEDVVRTRGGKP